MEVKKSKSVLKTVFNVIVWVFLVFALTLTIVSVIGKAANKEYPVFGDKCFLTVKSDSMDGEDGKGFKVNDLIICRTLNEEERSSLIVGQVITFYYDVDGDGQSELNTHRIISVNPSNDNGDVEYTTQGDSKKNKDAGKTEIVDCHHVIALWEEERVAGIGGIVSFFQSPTGFFCTVVIPMGALFVYELVTFILTLKKYKEEKSGVKTFTKEEEELIKQKAIEEYLAKQKTEENK